MELIFSWGKSSNSILYIAKKNIYIYYKNDKMYKQQKYIMLYSDYVAVLYTVVWEGHYG